MSQQIAKQKPRVLLPVVATLAAVAICSAVVFVQVRQNIAEVAWPQAVATIESLQVDQYIGTSPKTTAGYRGRTATVSVSYNVGGKDYQASLTTTDSFTMEQLAARYGRGAPTPIYYNPKFPQEVVLTKGLGFALLNPFFDISAIVVLVTIAAVVGGTVLFVRRLKSHGKVQ